jgi:hypothetical protein
MPNRGEFRATTDQLLEMLDELRTMEQMKRSLALGTPEFVEQAIKAADQDRLVLRWTQMQLEWPMSRPRASHAASKPRTSISLRSSHGRSTGSWPTGEKAQLRLEIARPGSAEAASAADDIERFREEYQIAHDALLQEC